MTIRKLLKLGIAYIIMFFVVYVCASFSNGTTDMALWSQSTRDALAGMLPALVMLIAFFVFFVED